MFACLSTSYKIPWLSFLVSYSSKGVQGCLEISSCFSITVPSSCSPNFQYTFSHFSVLINVPYIMYALNLLIFQYFQNNIIILPVFVLRIQYDILVNPYTWRLCHWLQTEITEVQLTVKFHCMQKYLKLTNLY